MTTASRPAVTHRLVLLAQAWWALATIRLALHRVPLPALVERLATVDSVRRAPDTPPPRALGRLVWRRLRVGSWRPSCLVRALVLYRLLALSGTSSQLVIGLPEQPTNQDAHAWIEIDGVEVGPPPGRIGHQELARYGK